MLTTSDGKCAIHDGLFTCSPAINTASVFTVCHLQLFYFVPLSHFWNYLFRAGYLSSVELGPEHRKKLLYPRRHSLVDLVDQRRAEYYNPGLIFLGVSFVRCTVSRFHT